MRLFTPVSPEEAVLMEQGTPVSDSLFWTDSPVPEGAEDDAVWVEMEVPLHDVAAFEQPYHPELGYREFELPPSIPAELPVRRISLD